MWKVVLVEDEVFVRRKLRKLIQWEEFGFTVSGEASNGEEALELIRQNPPDLVITDIMMPVMDGIELLRQARKAGMESRFVMLTCMNEFEYAQQALEFGASGYILKLSMSIQTMQDILAKVEKELAVESEQKQRALSQKWEIYYKQVWDSFEAERREEASSPVSPEVSLPPSSDYNRVFLLTFFNGFPLHPEELLKQKVIESTPGMWTGSHTSGNVTTLFYWSRTEPVIHWDKLLALPGKGVFSRPFSPYHLPRRWKRHLHQLNELWYDGHSGYIAEKDESMDMPTQRRSYPAFWNAEKEAIQAFEQMRKAELTVALTEYWEGMKEKRADINWIRETAVRLERTFASIAGADDKREINRQLDSAISHDELLMLLTGQSAQYLEDMSRRRIELTDHPEINRILEYLHQHYDQNLTLKAMARLVAMEEHYLSRLFKQKTGESLISYIQNVRIEKAKLLLQETELSISDIGRNVGFPSDNYFVKTFKKRCEKTPGQYRKEAAVGVSKVHE